VQELMEVVAPGHWNALKKRKLVETVAELKVTEFKSV